MRPLHPRNLSKRGRLLAAAAAAGLLITGLTGAAPVAAAAVPGSATGPTGQTLTVSNTENLTPKGATLTVKGSGYAPDKGVYLAFCAVPEKAGEQPTPCIGGADMSGITGSSFWISNNPPEYAKDLVKPFAVGADGKGSFELNLTVKATEGDIDCTRLRCAVVTKADHTHFTERDQDVVVPVTFGSGTEEPTPEVPEGTVRHTVARTFGTAARAVAVDPADGRVHTLASPGTDHFLTTYDGGSGERVGDAAPVTPSTGVMALDAAGKRLYVGHTGSVTVHDSLTGAETGEPITFSGSAGHLAVDPAAERLYVANQTTKSVSVYDTRTRQPVGAPVVLPFAAFGLAVDTENHLGYATYVGGAVENGSVVYRNVLNTIDGATGTLAATLSIGDTALGSQGVAIDGTSRTGYVANLSAGTVSVVDLAANRVTGTLPVGGNPKAMVYDRATGLLYVARLTGTTVAVVDPAAESPVIDAVEVGGSPTALALDPVRHSVHAVAGGEVHTIERQVSPTVTTSPEDTTVTTGDEVALTAAAEGTPDPVVLWEVSPDGGQSWNTVADSADATLSFKALAAQDGYRYRAVFSNAVGSSRTTAARLTVTPADDGGGTDGGADGGATGGGAADGGGTDAGADGGTAGGTDGGGSTDGGTAGGSTTTSGGATSGGSTSAGATAGGSTAAGSTTAGSTAAGSTGGDSTTAGGTVGGADTIGGTGGGLASTGSSVLPLAGTAALLILAGVAAVFVRRRRSATAA
ncbi:endoglucanase [Streptomyces corynorhini]|uniref:Endoglucanase n=1 Tax=Streptomyces corynorhini TaxID=2282652 RepID=A0A370BGM8_9ACTN|nr:endoglucanase [Streptomyces corynorhini]RDG38826.1 endoglucanase [Streptomyces corynorhini]